MKTNILLKSLFLFLGITFSILIKGQEIQGQTYTITSNGSVTDIQPYILALNNSNMRYHRLKNTRHTIEFTSGVKVELFSATEINASLHTLNISEYPETFSPNRDIPVFSLGPNNFIMEEHHTKSKFH
jgi:hypothetical protein